MGLFKRNKVWWMTFVYQGRQIRRSTECTDRRLAEAVLGKIKVKLVEGRYFDRLEERRTFERWSRKRYVAEACRGSSQSRVNDEHEASWLIFTGLRQKRPWFRSHRRELPRTNGNGNKREPQTHREELALMKTAFNVAIREWEWCQTIRCAGCRWAR
ncbi:MAG: hypothetical protein KF793_09140 [Nitrospira sp.]|nr:hypothetical protein [Nitrospira sp.]